MNDEYFDNAPFRCLGYNHSHYFYLPVQTKQVVSLTPDKHSQSNLLALAPLNWWGSQYPAEKGIAWIQAKNAMLRQCEETGIYNPEKIRGCGAWIDNGRIVLHLGDILIVDGSEMTVTEIASRYIYELEQPIELSTEEPLPIDKAEQLKEIFNLLTWEQPFFSHLLAGWCVIAPICGVLTWRPHIWVTGAAGTGKTWVVENIVNPLLGSMALIVQSNTTEAGIRQILGNNALPVVFDEAESTNRTSQSRMRNVLELMRQSSSETGGRIIKGTQSGHAISFRIRSCFCLSSIGVNIDQYADSTRVSILSLKKAHPDDRIDLFDELKTKAVSTLTESFCAGLRARAIQMIPTIRESIEVFKRAFAERYGDQRMADQLGTLLAGAYTLESDDPVTIKTANEWVYQYDWLEHSVMDTDTDEERCLHAILQHSIRIQGDNGYKDYTVAKLALIASGIESSHDMTQTTASKTLEGKGIKLRSKDNNNMFVVSNSHKEVSKILSNTRWETGWHKSLERIDGSESISSFRFDGLNNRATGIPLDVIFGKEVHE